MSLQDKFDADKTTMANGKAGIFRRVWDRLMAMDYSSFDYSMDRIGALEREVAQLKVQLQQATTSDNLTMEAQQAGETHSKHAAFDE